MIDSHDPKSKDSDPSPCITLVFLFYFCYFPIFFVWFSLVKRFVEYSLCLLVLAMAAHPPLEFAFLSLPLMVSFHFLFSDDGGEGITSTNTQ